MTLIELVGTAAGLCSMASFVPQIVKIVRDRDAEGVSLRMYLVTVTGFVLWIAYGLLLGSWPVWVSNGVNLALASAILLLKLRYPGSPMMSPRVDSRAPDRKTASHT